MNDSDCGSDWLYRPTPPCKPHPRLDRFSVWFVRSRLLLVLLWLTRPLRSPLDRFASLHLADAFGFKIRWVHLTGERGVNDVISEVDGQDAA